MLNAFSLAQHIAMLSIEVNTGMRHSRGSVLKSAQRQFGITASTKARALVELKALYFEVTGREYGSPTESDDNDQSQANNT